MKIVFAHPSHEHQSYFDYRRLVHVSGFETCRISEIDLSSDAVYIISPATGEIQALKDRPRRCKLVWWCLERLDSGDWPPEGNNASNSVDRIAPIVNSMWTSDRHQALMDLRLRFVTLASDTRLAEGSPDPCKIYDVAWLAYNSRRRRPIFDQLSRWKLAPSPAWGEMRARILNSSRCMAYVHQTNSPVGAPLRFALAAAYKLPVISERIESPIPCMPGRDYVEASYDKFLDLLEERLSEGDLRLFGENLHQTLCMDRTFRSCVQDAVREAFL